MFKKYIIFLLLAFTILSCGTDYMLSSFYLRNNDLKWMLFPSQQTNLDYYTHIVGNSKINEYNSPVIKIIYYQYMNIETSLKQL